MGAFTFVIGLVGWGTGPRGFFLPKLMKKSRSAKVYDADVNQ
jgi:hypothetical protein